MGVIRSLILDHIPPLIPNHLSPLILSLSKDEHPRSLFPTPAKAGAPLSTSRQVSPPTPIPKLTATKLPSPPRKQGPMAG